MNQSEKLTYIVPSCQDSGSIGTYCEGLPGVLFLCATRSGETSHAGLYNDACYGNVYRNTVEEFLKPR